ncbi:MAG: GTPase HflX [Curvibacter sp.]|nr:MAG: GTPase HflX [Curvibacter sp.]
MGVDLGVPNFDSELEELGLLAQTAGLQPVGRIVCKRRAPDAALFVGSGKAEEIRQLALQTGATEILFDQALSPGQQRNLERHMQLPVNDRTFLILEIFAQRARSHEGKLQVELARLQYLSTRLVRRWSHLERQRGGIGTRGGPGETQIELDRRMISENIKRTKERLSKVKRQRQTQRRQRERRDAFNISLIGYTNAGKSTLFNALVKARAYAADQLFATLDTTTRQLYLGEAGRTVSLSDTVGFIRDLPHGLVDAFQATLQEAIDADLLLHVVDAANVDFPEQIAQVQSVLKEIGAENIPQLLVFNKVDAIPEDARPVRSEDTYEIEGAQTPRLFVSARTLSGIPLLRQKLADIAKTEADSTDLQPIHPEPSGDGL